MQTRRDQVQAHMFAVSRLNAAMLLNEPDALETPLGRTRQALTSGLAIGVLVIAVIVGLQLVNSSSSDSTSWQSNGELVTVNTTGAQYLYLDATLHPVANYASAMLIDGGVPNIASVAETALAGVPLGSPVGIAGAPADLPAASALSKRDWLVCSGAGSAAASAATVTTTVVATSTPPSSLLVSEALPVTGSDGTRYLIWNGRRLRVGSATVTQYLGYATATWIPVSTAFLDALPAGPELTAPDVPGEGQATSLAGEKATIGELFEMPTASGTQFYQLQSTGLVPVTPLGADLIEAAQHVSGGATIDDPGAALDHVSTATAFSGLPQTPPVLAEAATSEEPCLTWDPAGSPPAYNAALVPASALGTVVARMESSRSGATAAVESGTIASPKTGAVDACEITTQTGVAVLATAVKPAAGTAAASVASGVSGMYLVSDEGVKYSLSTDAVKDLGYTEAEETPVPAYVLSLLETGPALSPAAADADPDTGATASMVPTAGVCP